MPLGAPAKVLEARLRNSQGETQEIIGSLHFVYKVWIGNVRNPSISDVAFRETKLHLNCGYGLGMFDAARFDGETSTQFIWRRTSMSLATRPDIRGFQSLMIPDSVMKKSVMDSLTQQKESR